LDTLLSNATQIGITSFTFGGCGSAFYPDVFTKVASYSGWIRSELRSDFCYDEKATRFPTVTPTPAPTPQILVESQSSTPRPTPNPEGATTQEGCSGLFSALTNVITSVMGEAGASHVGTTYTAVADDDTVAPPASIQRGFLGWFKDVLEEVAGEETTEVNDNKDKVKDDKNKGEKDKGGGKDNTPDAVYVNGIVVGPAKPAPAGPGKKTP
jgi:hypothetical protein